MSFFKGMRKSIAEHSNELVGLGVEVVATAGITAATTGGAATAPAVVGVLFANHELIEDTFADAALYGSTTSKSLQ